MSYDKMSDEKLLEIAGAICSPAHELRMHFWRMTDEELLGEIEDAYSMMYNEDGNGTADHGAWEIVREYARGVMRGRIPNHMPEEFTSYYGTVWRLTTDTTVPGWKHIKPSASEAIYTDGVGHLLVWRTDYGKLWRDGKYDIEETLAYTFSDGVTESWAVRGWRKRAEAMNDVDLVRRIARLNGICDGMAQSVNVIEVSEDFLKRSHRQCRAAYKSKVCTAVLQKRAAVAQAPVPEPETVGIYF